MVQGKVVVITGGAKGIGRYIAHTFAREGARVAVGDVDVERLRNVERELGELGTEALAVTTDVRDEASVRALMDQVAARFGGIDALVNNAGIVPHFQWGVPRWPRVRDMDLSFWNRVIETNLGGTFLGTKHVIPHLEARGGGHIVNLYGGGSPQSLGSCSYVVTKEAIRYFTRYVAEEVRESNICVVALSPGGAIATEDAPEEARQRMPGPELAGNRFVLAAQAPMELSGQLLTLQDGRLAIEEPGRG